MTFSVIEQHFNFLFLLFGTFFAWNIDEFFPSNKSPEKQYLCVLNFILSVSSVA